MLDPRLRSTALRSRSRSLSRETTVQAAPSAATGTQAPPPLLQLANSAAVAPPPALPAAVPTGGSGELLPGTYAFPHSPAASSPLPFPGDPSPLTQQPDTWGSSPPHQGTPASSRASSCPCPTRRSERSVPGRFRGNRFFGQSASPHLSLPPPW